MTEIQPSTVVNALVEQAQNQIDDGHDAFTTVCALPVERLSGIGDERAKWHYQYGLGPHVRAITLREINDWQWIELHDFLETNDHAQTIGYVPEKFADDADAPSYTALYRAWNEYFSPELKQIVTETVARIREYARKTGNLIGSQTLEAEDKQNVSKRTEYRVKRRLAHEMSDKFRDLFYDKLDLNLPDNAEYSKEDLLDLFLHIALTDDFANNGADTWREEVDDEETAPSGDTLRDRIRLFDELDRGEVSQMFQEVSELLWSIADQHGYLDNIVDTAIDGHAWRFYGDDDAPRISSVKPERGTDKAYDFFTLSVIGDEGEKFVIAIRQVASTEEKLAAVEELAREANDRLHLHNVFADRGFYGTQYAKALESAGVKFVIRSQKGSKSEKLWEEAEDNVNYENNLEMSRSREPYVSVKISRFVIEANDNVDDEYMAFITNRTMTDSKALRLGKLYLRRWAIETSFRVTNDFLPKTASKDVALRVFYYRMAVLLYDIWILLNAVVAESIGWGRGGRPPVTAKYLLTVMRKQHRRDTSIS